ncbi:carbamoyltransferase HypF [Aquimarina celericrescens]|uniref:Carbamoyltransferase n=1 Tax=Aquimarina celericrescens TaxID=1964542 RepID=A0ABW5ATC2_9FLAO|nr:carbamoyltransferase HypF [Aquimarina celericrescens]
MYHTFKITITGQVQGVGFRPFIYGLAKEHQLKGAVLNNENGVVVYLNTTKEKVNNFIEHLLQKKPSISVLQSHKVEEVEYTDFKDFSINISQKKSKINIPLTPDFAVCDQCKNEITNSQNKRFQYAFTTCTNCGPRYSITSKFPFERAHTSMNSFMMCDSCKSEYTNPSDRRFHSQTNSCPECGVLLTLLNSKSETIEKNQQEIIAKVANLISDGNIIAIKNTNGYLLCCDANNKQVIQELRTRKKRPNKPFALLYPSMNIVKEYVEVSLTAEIALTSTAAPIVILPVKHPKKLAINTIAPNLNQLGIMLPSSTLLHILVNKLNSPIVATSGNIHGSPIISTQTDAEKHLSQVADYFLHHDLDIQFPQDDSVLKFSGDQQLILRRSRGLAPNYLTVNSTYNKPTLAMGAHLKSTFAFIPNANIYVSQYFGNLDSYDVSERYTATINKYISVFETKPNVILVDKHPQYQSTILGKSLAEKWSTQCIQIQHHKAHFASVLGEHNLFDSKNKILGIVWDGTGLGDDNSIWGGEFFVYQNRNIERSTHFEYFDWIANNKMAQEPRLALLSLTPKKFRNNIKYKFSETEWKIYIKILQNSTLKTSSVGRLFDAVASLLDITDINTFEGEAAMRLENCASRYDKKDYIDFLQGQTYERIPTSYIIKKVFQTISKDVNKEKIAASFMYTLARIIINIAKKNNFKIIACSGGVFQNAILVSYLMQFAENERLNLKFNRKLSSNDENISLGQFFYYKNIKN